MIRKLAASLLALVTLAVGAQGASADTTAVDEAALRLHMGELGIQTDVQDSLIGKIMQGQLPDSDLSGSVPLSVESTRTVGMEGTREIFADGSVRLVEHAIPANPRLRSTSIAGCTLVAGTGYRDYRHCTVGSTGVLVSEYFVADFMILSGSNNDYISRAYGGTVRCYLGACDGAQVNLIQANETVQRAALAMATTTFSVLGVYASRTYGVSLSVGGDSYAIGEF